jgi:CBS domain containing-hemolysin-like protein
MTALALVAVVVLVLLNGFYVIAEYALVRSRRQRLEPLVEEGDKKAALVVRQLDEIDDYISTSQVGVTLCSIAIGALGEPAIAGLLEDAFPDAVAHGVSVVISVVIAYLIVTSLHIVVGELVPKLYAIDHAEPIARRAARPLNWSRIVFGPFTAILSKSAHGILRLMGIDAARIGEDSATPDELKRIIAESSVGGHLDPGEATMLSGVFHLHEQQARQVMTPAPALVTVDVSEDVETALRRCVSSGHTRMIVTEDNNRDRVKGTVHSNQLAQLLLAQGTAATIDHLVRDVPIVPETKPLDDLLADLQRERTSLAVVIDEYGRTAGIVTVEDIVEEVVGEITDETDPLGGAVRQLANGDWFVRGHVAIDDLRDYGLDMDVDSDAYNSVGGFVFGEIGRLPRRGDTIQVDGYSIRVESVRENRIEAVRIRERRASVTPAPAS